MLLYYFVNNYLKIFGGLLQKTESILSSEYGSMDHVKKIKDLFLNCEKILIPFYIETIDRE